ncbi:hypothetical protein [Tenacibaculum mesophilum]|uniref:hypothetical protein n=1 Tax=Tenacibaculum mesophilum TaxID=104268 RepID=UPI00069DF5B4|nr:hypothetical protein [Tenacibaculum mesophilum]
MSYSSTVYRILIASPSDVSEEREVTTRLIQNWNDVNSYSKKIVLLPLKWETHSSPTYDVRPQEAINRQLVDSADLVIGLFWAKIGSDTGIEISGTIEEIKRAANNGKDVMIYFSKRGIDPSEIDLKQLEALNKFKKEVYKNALIENFNSVIDFRDKLNRQLEFKIRELEKNNKEAKTKLDLSFVNQSNNELENDTINIESDLIKISKAQIDDIVKKEDDIGDRTWEFKSDLNKYVEKINSVPIVLGVNNKDSIIHTNLNIDLQLKVNITDSMTIRVLGASKNQGISNSLTNGKLREEDEKNIQSLFNETLEKVDSKTMNVYMESTTVLPNKIKCIKPIILINPRKDVKLEFHTKLLSNNLLEPISKKLTLNIKVTEREIKSEEIKSIIDNLPDDLPF